MAKSILIPTGATLSGLAKQYGTSVQDLMTLNPDIKDPNKIFAGKSLNIPELQGTLPTETGVGEKKLPEPTFDRLSMFQEVMRDITSKAGQEAKVAGATALPEGMLKPEQVSGGTFAGILKLVSQQKTRGISDIYTSTLDMITRTKESADRQLTTLINTGAIKDLDDTALKRLSDLTEYPLDYLQTIQKQVKEKTTALSDADRIIEINDFMKDKIGLDTKISAESYKEAYKKWIGLNGSIADFKYVYPVEDWVGTHEWKNLPSGWKPQTPAMNTLPSDQQVFINQVQDKINTGDLTYDEAVGKYPKIAFYLKP